MQRQLRWCKWAHSQLRHELWWSQVEQLQSKSFQLAQSAKCYMSCCAENISIGWALTVAARGGGQAKSLVGDTVLVDGAVLGAP
jgi:hypothetical protein